MRILVRFAFPDTFIFALHIAMKTQCVTQVLVTSRSNEYVTAAEHSGQIAHWYSCQLCMLCKIHIISNCLSGNNMENYIH